MKVNVAKLDFKISSEITKKGSIVEHSGKELEELKKQGLVEEVEMSEKQVEKKIAAQNDPEVAAAQAAEAEAKKQAEISAAADADAKKAAEAPAKPKKSGGKKKTEPSV